MQQRELFLNHVGQTSTSPLMLDIDRAEGIYMYAKDKTYIDLISGINVSNIGHSHPAITSAIKEQADKYLHLMVYGEFVQTPQIKLAKALSDTLPSSLDNIFFVNSGSEAVEGALKLAKRYTGKHKIIACHECYHGSSTGAVSLLSDETYKRKFRPLLPGISHINFNNPKDLDQIDGDTAAVIIETVQGEAGILPGDPAYFKALRQKCNETGTLLIFDEIQTGFGRTGTFWALEWLGVTPDILVCAKGMGGGMPIGAFISSKEIMTTLTDNPVLGHISTFGGHSMSCAASLATLDTIIKDKLIDSVKEKEALILRLIDHPSIVSKRSCGLMLAFEFEDYDTLKKVIDKAIELGVLTDWFLWNSKSMRIAPPLTITEEQIHDACEIIVNAIKTA